MSQLPLFPDHVIPQWRYNVLQAELTKALEKIKKLEYSQRAYKGNSTKRRKKA